MELDWLGITAFWIGLTHTLLGPDHYVPFVAMSRSADWSLRKTLVVTWLCGLGHVGSSLLLGLAGLAGGVALQSLDAVEETRGDWAAWLMIGFGLAYAVWGIGRAIRRIPHSHLHTHPDGTWHAHTHGHNLEHLHVHAGSEAVSPPPAAIADQRRLTPWVLFVIFLFGPCEPLIPLFLVPAAARNYEQAVWVALLFGFATLITMTACVVVLRHGVGFLRWQKLDRFSHAFAGIAILACGVAVKLGL